MLWVSINVIRRSITAFTRNLILATGSLKVFGEMLGSLYADKYGLEVFLIRIGSASPTPGDLHGLAMWVSPRDLAQLIAIGIDHPDVHFEIVYGISGNSRSWYDNSNAERLGHVPPDDFKLVVRCRSALTRGRWRRARRALPGRAIRARNHCLSPLAWQ